VRVLIWHVHGSYTTALVQGPHEYLLPRLPDRGPYGRGRALTWDWPASAIEVTREEAAELDVDVVILQRPEELNGLCEGWLGGRRPGWDVPAIYLEHNAPQGRIADMRHPAADRPELTVVRRPEAFGAGALVLAGVAANVSLSLSWSPGEGPTGLSLVQRGGEALDSGVAASVRSDVWEPLVVVLCGGLLVLLGFLLLVPARAHRLVGLVALVVSLAATAAVLFVVSDVGWRVDGFGPGTWCAVAIPVLGLLGSLKAMLTAPRVTLAPSSTASSDVAA